jgi:hypothetical protein
MTDSPCNENCSSHVQISRLGRDSSIEDYLVEFKLLVVHMKGCRKNKLDEECIFLILSKLKDPFQVVSSMFYSTMDALGDEFKIPYFNILCEHLTREKSKLVQLDSLSGSKNQSLMAHTSKG